MPSRRGELGAWGEEQASAFLQRQGLVVLDRNYHTTTGEIDIVARQGSDYYFVEVKTRRAGPFAFDTSVTPTKIRKLNKTIRAYLYRHSLGDVGVILASLLVVVDPLGRRVRFRLAVIC